MQEQLKHIIYFIITLSLDHIFLSHKKAVLVFNQAHSFFFFRLLFTKTAACATLFQAFTPAMKLASLALITHLVQSCILYLFVPTSISPAVRRIHQLGFQMLCRLYVLWPLAVYPRCPCCIISVICDSNSSLLCYTPTTRFFISSHVPLAERNLHLGVRGGRVSWKRH